MERNELSELIGPFYDAAGAAEVLGLSVSELNALGEQGRVLGVETRDGVMVYPAFQFVDGQVPPALAAAFEALALAPRWSVATWCVTPNDDLDGVAPVEWVRRGRRPETLAESARRTAVEWR